jgi:chromosome segregation ATPase
MPVRRTLQSALFRTIESPLSDWIDRHPRPDDSAAQRLAALEEQNAKLEKKLSMAMGAIQAASAQIVQLRSELEAAQNLAHQAMQKATTAQATAESATEGVTALEGARPAEPRLEGKAEGKAESKAGPPRKPRARATK